LKRSNLYALVVAFLVILLSAGCAGVGPGNMTRDRFDYTAAISESWKNQMLLNMVKMRYGDAPVFLDVTSVINQYILEGLVELGAGLNTGLIGENTASVKGAGRYSDRPTITYTPLLGEKFARSLMTPIPPVAIFNLVQAGYPIDIVFRLTVHSINGIQNRYGGGARARQADSEFFPLLERMREMQNRGTIGIRVQKLNEKEAVLLVLHGKRDEKFEAEMMVTRKVLGLDPKGTGFRVVYGAVSSNDKEIAIITRSMLEIIIELSSYMEVPSLHVEEKRVNPTFKDEPVDGEAVPPLIRIHSSPTKPEEAFVSVPYRGYWFWIDDRDLPSKRMFSFLMFVFTLTETGGKEGAPIVTIPAG
jgi:hypothetical protein